VNRHPDRARRTAVRQLILCDVSGVSSLFSRRSRPIMSSTSSRIARQSFEASLATVPTARGHQNLAIVLIRQDRLADAERHFRAALALLPDYSEAQSGLGAVLARQGRYREAIAAYQEAVRLTPSLAPAHADLGMALASDERTDEAIAALSRAISLDPEQSRWRYAWRGSSPNAANPPPPSSSSKPRCGSTRAMRPRERRCVS
jgi:tetratricopeptide (TPR) repeat protein